MRAVSPWLLALALALPGCSTCEGDPVPFGLDAGPGGGAEADPERPAGERPVGRAFPDGTRRVDIEGAPVEVEGSLRSLWLHDVDGDGDRDALAIESGPPETPARVVFIERRGARFAEPRVLGRAPAAPEGCLLDSATLEPLGEAWLVARARLACEEHPSAAREELWILSTGRTPRSLEHLAVLAPEGRAAGEVTLSLSIADRDEDGHPDLVVGASVGRDGEPTTIELPWLDRPSGLARDAAEPERTLGQRSIEALRRLRRDPTGALTASRDVLALHEALCREPGRARLRIGETGGLSCGTSAGAGRAATTVVRALAQQGERLAALDALERMSTPGLLINDERRRYAREAIASAPASGDVTTREGPDHTAPSWTAARRSALAFLDEDHLVLRGDRPRVWDVSTGAIEDMDPSQSELRLLDPSKRYAVTGVERRCDGHVLSIVPAGSLVGGNVFGGPHSLPLLEPRDPPPGAPCPDLTPALRRDTGGWQILGWAPQGVVAARDDELRVVPLDMEARPAGDPTALEPGTPPPAPLAPGVATSDGRFFVELRGLGVVLHRTAPSPEATVLWPEGWAESEATPTDPAISPSGRRVAVLRGGHVVLLER